jgi:hypothetical protein
MFMAEHHTVFVRSRRTPAAAAAHWAWMRPNEQEPVEKPKRCAADEPDQSHGGYRERRMEQLLLAGDPVGDQH